MGQNIFLKYDYLPKIQSTTKNTFVMLKQPISSKRYV